MLQKLKPYNVVRELKEKKLHLFTPLDFKRVFRVSDYATQWFIKAHTKDGLFVKLRNGLYMLADDPASPGVIANRLYQPSYISFDTALSFYGIIPETIYNVTSATTRATRKFKVGNILFAYHKIKKEVYTGYGLVAIPAPGEKTVLMAAPEKALADYLYFVALGKRGLHYERLDLNKIKKSALMKYALEFNQPRMIQLIQKIYADLRKPKRIR